MLTTVDEAGRIRLPEEVRRKLMLLPRDPLLFQLSGDQIMAQRATPLPAAAQWVRRRLGRLLQFRRPAAPI